ncbi:HIT family protein [Candidatus Woesearchaeota archaeon]|nr:HIT family protein [Candidatus Woesearchaeota archaeon]MBI2130868.1 HIT family protein [Candidatus Woesearchaeota archaeon]
MTAQSQFTPEQLQALQEKIKNMSPEELKEFQKKQCVFCQIIEGKVQSKKVYEDDICYAILDINPANPGHLLLMTKEHYTIMPQLHDDEIAHVFSVAKMASNVMLRSLEAQGTNIIVANGVAAGQRAQHFMVHVIPRKEGDGLNFEIPQRKMSQQEIDDAGDKIISVINSIPGGEEMITRAEPIAEFRPKRPIDAEFEEVKEKKPKARKKAEGKHREGGSKGADEKAVSDINLDDIAKLMGGK